MMHSPLVRLALALCVLAVLPAAHAQGRKAKRNAADPAQTDVAGARAAERFQPTRTLVYKKVGDAELKLHVFAPAGHRPTDRTPAVVFFFGGGFRVGSASQFFGQSAYLASRGMVAISAEYRIKTVHGTGIDACIADAKSAMRWVRGHAAELGIDPTRLGAGGGSAGGFLAAATADLTVFDAPGEDTSVSCRPDALLLFNGPIDATPSDAKAAGPDRLRVVEAAGLEWRDVSPLHHIEHGFPPMAFFVGDQDHLIPASQIHAIHAAMAKAGSRLELHVYPGQQHGFFNYDRHGGEYFKRTLLDADAFLVSLGWLKGAPNPDAPVFQR